MSYLKMSDQPGCLESSSDSENELCAACFAVGDRRRAVKYCIDCVQLVCQNCVDFHRRYKQMKEHKLVDTGKANDLKFSKMLSSILACPNHPDKTVELVCKNHDALCCLTCATVSHRSCSEVVEVSKEAIDPKQNTAVESLKNHLKGADQHISTIIKEHVKNKAELIAAADIHIPAKLREINAKINQIFAELEQSILQQCAKKKRLSVAQRDNELGNWVKERESVREASGFLSSVKQNGSDAHLYIVMNQLQKKLNAVDEAIAKQGNVLQMETISLKEGTGLQQVLSGIPCNLAEACTSKSVISLPRYKFTKKDTCLEKSKEMYDVTRHRWDSQRYRCDRGRSAGYHGWGGGYTGESAYQDVDCESAFQDI